MAEEAVKKYLATTNRPYSANDIVMNLHKQFGKSAVQKALDILVSENVVLEKTYGKQKVYVIKQDPDDCPTAEDIKELEEKLQISDVELRKFKEDLKSTELQLEIFKNSPSMSTLTKKIEIINNTIDELKSKLEALSKNSVPISPKKLNKVKEDNDRIVREFRKRKRMCMDVVNTISESYPKSKNDLLQEIGIETDEDVGFPTKIFIKS